MESPSNEYTKNQTFCLGKLNLSQFQAGAWPQIRNGGEFFEGLGAEPLALENFAFFCKIIWF